MTSFLLILLLVMMNFCNGLTSASLKLMGPECERQCEDDIILEDDKCLFTCHVNLTGQFDQPMFSFQSSQDPTTFAADFHIKDLFNECSNDISYNCSKSGNSSFVIKYTVTAIVSGSNKLFRCKVMDIISNNKSFPKVQDSRNHSISLMINNKSVHEHNCTITIADKQLNLEFKCLSEALPCVINITANDTAEINQYNNEFVFNRSIENGQALNVSIKFAACSLHGHYDQIICIFRAVDRNIDTLPTNVTGVLYWGWKTILGFVLAALTALIIFVLCIINCRRICNWEKLKHLFRKCHRYNPGNPEETYLVEKDDSDSFDLVILKEIKNKDNDFTSPQTNDVGVKDHEKLYLGIQTLSAIQPHKPQARSISKDMKRENYYILNPLVAIIIDRFVNLANQPDLSEQEKWKCFQAFIVLLLDKLDTNNNLDDPNRNQSRITNS